MSKTYRGWAEVEDWNIHRVFRRSHKRKSEIEWRKAATREIEQPEDGSRYDHWEYNDER